MSNDYLLSNATNKENYYLNDGSMFSSGNEANQKKDSPLSSGFSSLSSSLTSSSMSATNTNPVLFNCDSSLLSRSSSTCSLLTTNIQREQFKKESTNKSSGCSSASSSPSASSSSSPGPTAAESNLAFSFHNPAALSIQNFVDIFQLSQSNDLSSKSNLTKNTFSNIQEQSHNYFDDNLKQQQQQQAFKSAQPAANKIDWNILNNSEVYLNQNREDFKWISKLNKEFWWNMNKLVEINQKLNEAIKSSHSSFNNSKLNLMPKQHVPVAARKTAHPLQPQQALGPYMHNLNAMTNMNGFNYNYNGSQQQLNSRVFGRVITNNRGFSQRIQ